MDKYVIDGGRKLYGTVALQSAKNSVLPLLAASAVATLAVCAVVGTEWSWGLAVVTWLMVCMGLLAIGALEDEGR